MDRFGYPDEEIRKIPQETAMRWFSFAPFRHVPRQQATVGALRAAAAGHDISIRSRSHRIIDPSEKLEAYRSRARAATAAAQGASAGRRGGREGGAAGEFARAGEPRLLRQ